MRLIHLLEEIVKEAWELNPDSKDIIMTYPVIEMESVPYQNLLEAVSDSESGSLEPEASCDAGELCVHTLSVMRRLTIPMKN